MALSFVRVQIAFILKRPASLCRINPEGTQIQAFSSLTGGRYLTKRKRGLIEPPLSGLL
jgi:hypothetical protein